MAILMLPASGIGFCIRSGSRPPAAGTPVASSRPCRSRPGGDRLDRQVARLERDPGTLDASGLHVCAGRLAGFAAEGAGEVAVAHAGAARECRDGEVLVEMVRDPRLELAQRRAVGGLGGQLGAELRLAAGALHEDDEMAGGLSATSRPRSSSTSASARSI